MRFKARNSSCLRCDRFPCRTDSSATTHREIEQAVEAGAREIDVVIARNYVLTGDWQSLYDELTTIPQQPAVTRRT